MIPLAEMQTRIVHYARALGKDTRWQLCSTCPMKQCQPKAVGCQCRKLIAERRRECYWRSPEKHRARARAENLSPERLEAMRERKRLYTDESRHIINFKQRERYQQTAERKKAKERERYQRKREEIRAYQRANAKPRDMLKHRAYQWAAKLNKLIEDAPVLATECAPVGIW